MTAREPALPVEPIVATATTGNELETHVAAGSQLWNWVRSFIPSWNEPKRPSPSQLGFDLKSSLDEYYALAGWVVDQRIVRQQLSHKDIDGIQKRTIVMTRGKDGRIYKLDPDHPDKIIGFDPNVVPDHKEWDAAKASPSQFLLTHYKLAQTNPLEVANALIFEPNTQLQQALLEAAVAHKRAAKQIRTPALLEGLAKLDKKVEAAKHTKDTCESLYDFMRIRIFHTDVEAKQVVQEFMALDPTFNSERFLHLAKYKSTPEQLWDLAASLFADSR